MVLPIQKYIKVSWNSNSEIITIRNNYYANIVLDINNNSYTVNLIVDVTNDSNDDWNTIYFRDYPSAFQDKENGNISEITNIDLLKKYYGENNEILKQYIEEKYF